MFQDSQLRIIDDWHVNGGTVNFQSAWQDFLLEANLVYLLHARKQVLNQLEFLDVWKMDENGTKNFSKPRVKGKRSTPIIQLAPVAAARSAVAVL